MPGRLVLRSLTKTWGLAGLRVGYVVGDPALIALLAAQQPPWSVSTPAIRAAVACTSPRASAEASRLAEEAARARADLAARLTDAGLAVVPGHAPFVLADASALSPTSLREPLAERGFAVRRGETFPGLGPTWLRFAVRTPDVHRRLAAAFSALKRPAVSASAQPGQGGRDIGHLGHPQGRGRTPDHHDGGAPLGGHGQFRVGVRTARILGHQHVDP